MLVGTRQWPRGFGHRLDLQRASAGPAGSSRCRFSTATSSRPATISLRSRSACPQIDRWRSLIKTSEEEHATYVWPFLAMYRETGDTTAALNLARWYVQQLPAWTHDDPLGARAAVLSALRLPGGLATDAWTRLRGEWLADARAFTPEGGASEVWLFFFAATAETREQANEALAAQSQYGAARRGGTRSELARDEAIGRVMLLAGRYAEAVEPLRSAARYCTPITGRELFTHRRAQEELGEALEAIGDTEGACASYRRLLSRWGNAKPRSVTAEHAREASRRLACARQGP